MDMYINVCIYLENLRNNIFVLKLYSRDTY